MQGQEGTYRAHPYVPAPNNKYGGGYNGRGGGGGGGAAEPMDDDDWESSTRTLPYEEGDGEGKQNTYGAKSA